MQGNRSRDTKPELAVRRLLHAAGCRYRVNHRPVAGLRRTADIVFTRQRIAVFIDGCFWHSCPIHGQATTMSNTSHWSAKLAMNVRRDLDTNDQLAEAGWSVMRFREHEPPSSKPVKSREPGSLPRLARHNCAGISKDPAPCLGSSDSPRRPAVTRCTS